MNTYSKLYDNDYNFLFKSIENINKEILDNVKNVINNKINEIDKKIIKNNHVIKYSDCDFLFKIVTANIQVTIVNEAKNIINSYFKLINQFKKTNRDYYFLLNIIENDYDTQSIKDYKIIVEDKFNEINDKINKNNLDDEDWYFLSLCIQNIKYTEKMDTTYDCFTQTY